MFSIVVPTVYGQMIVNRHDINQTGAPEGCATPLHQDRPGGTDSRTPAMGCPR